MVTDWPSARSLLRRSILAGDVSLSSSGYDDYRTHSDHGLDTDTRLTLCDLEYAIAHLTAPERLAVQADIGQPCSSSHTSLKVTVSRSFARLTQLLVSEPQPLVHWHREHIDQDILDTATQKILAYVLADSPNLCLTSG